MKLKITILIIFCATTHLFALDVQTLQGQFTQIRQQAMFDQPQQSKGVFYFVAPDKMRWEYTEPSSFGLIANKQDITLLQNGQKKQGNSQHAVQAMVSMIMQCIAGQFANNTQFDVATEQQTDQTIITLTPKKQNRRLTFTKMQITLDQTGILAKEVILWEKTGDCTTIKFTDLQVNQPIDNTLF